MVYGILRKIIGNILKIDDFTLKKIKEAILIVCNTFKAD